jgi:tRNA-2-methylthio-N6-dimethylallyladenosine synthase
VAEQEKEHFFEPVPAIDIVVGPDHYADLPALIQAARARKQHQVITGFDRGRPEDFLSSYPGQKTGATTQFLTIMKGCSQRCTYCIVPSVRGPERCRDVDSILSDAARLIEGGAKELMLLGQKVNGYKKDGVGFGRLLELLCDIDGLERLRFTSPHPMHMTDEVIDAFAKLPPLCESIHLPVQAGADSVLKRMKRRYTRSQYIDIAKRLKSTAPGFQIYTDLIVGFPGERQEDFEETLDLYETVRFAGAFSFKYSPRPGTVAAKEMTDDVGSDEKSRRLDHLHQIIERIEQEIKTDMVGQVQKILIEGPARLPGQMMGRTRNNQIVNVALPKNGILEAWLGRTVAVVIKKAMPHSLEGTLSERPEL